MPTKFFPKILLMPVLPPIDESTCASNVVGIFMNFIPLLKILAANADTSPIIPPPNEIIQSFLLKFFLNKTSKILSILLKFLFLSLDLNMNV